MTIARVVAFDHLLSYLNISMRLPVYSRKSICGPKARQPYIMRSRWHTFAIRFRFSFRPSKPSADNARANFLHVKQTGSDESPRNPLATPSGSALPPFDALHRSLDSREHISFPVLEQFWM